MELGPLSKKAKGIRFWTCTTSEKFDNFFRGRSGTGDYTDLRLDSEILNHDFRSPVSFNINEIINNIEEFGTFGQKYTIFSFTVPEKSYTDLVIVASVAITGRGYDGLGFIVCVQESFEKYKA